MLNVVEMANRVIRGTLEARATSSRMSEFCDDMRRFVRTAGVSTDIVTGTPADDVLYHIFGIATNTLIQKNGGQLIPGPKWSVANIEGARILTGLISVGFSTNAALRRDLEVVHYTWEIVPSAIGNASDSLWTHMIRDTSFTVYPMADPNSMAVYANTVSTSTIISITNVSGRVKVTYPSFYWAPGDATTPGAVLINGASYVPVYPPDPSSLRMNGRGIITNEWMTFGNDFYLTANAPYTGVVFLTFDIAYYDASPNAHAFRRVGANPVPPPTAFLPPLPHSPTQWRQMYEKAMSAFGARTPQAIPSHFITTEYVEIILLLNAFFADVAPN